MSLFGILVACWDHVIQVIVAVAEFCWEFEFAGFALGGLLCFLLTCVVSNDFILCM